MDDLKPAKPVSSNTSTTPTHSDDVSVHTVTTTASSDQSWADDMDEGRDPNCILSDIGSIQMPPTTWVPSSDVLEAPPSGDPEPNAPSAECDPDAPRAQIDTGAFATCTGNKNLLHDYKEFSPD